MFLDNLEVYQEWITSLPTAVQWIALIVLGMIPYVEIHFAAVAGILSGISPVISILLAMLGNFVIVFLCIFFADKINLRFGKKEEELSKRRKKFNKSFEKYGVIGTSFFGWLILPSSVTSFLMITTAKVSKQKVLFWMTASIITWGIVLGVAVSIFNYLSF